MKPDYFGIQLWMLQKWEKWCASVPFCFITKQISPGKPWRKWSATWPLCKLALHMQYVHHPSPTEVGLHVVLEWPPWLTHGIQNCSQAPLGRIRCRCENSVEVNVKQCALCALLWTGSRDCTSNTKVWVSVSGLLVILFPQSFLVILYMHFLWPPSSTTSSTHLNVVYKSVPLV